MGKVNSLLTQRLKVATEKFSKIASLAEMSSSGNLSSFSGIFRVSQLTVKELDSLKELLTQFQSENQSIDKDLEALSHITAEVKAINNQAILLHGERIKKAQHLLKQYRDGAFTAWLLATYGNRQTPYNFLQYYELYLALPQPLHAKLDEMPRQALYTLASRNGQAQEKEAIIRNYKGEPKEELLQLIRQTFPLSEVDGRKEDIAQAAIQALKRLKQLTQHPKFKPSARQKQEIQELFQAVSSSVHNF